MRILSYLLFFIFSFNSFAQESEIKGKVIKADGEKKSKAKKQSSPRTINYNANNLMDAIKPILGPGVYFEDERVLFNTGSFFGVSNKYAEWAINATLVGKDIPLDVEVQDIQNVKVLRSAMETSRYGLRGSAGVIEITLKKE